MTWQTRGQVVVVVEVVGDAANAQGDGKKGAGGIRWLARVRKENGERCLPFIELPARPTKGARGGDDEMVVVREQERFDETKLVKVIRSPTENPEIPSTAVPGRNLHLDLEILSHDYFFLGNLKV